MLFNLIQQLLLEWPRVGNAGILSLSCKDRQLQSFLVAKEDTNSFFVGSF